MLTERSRVRRMPERGYYDRDTIHSILNAAFLCHVGFVHEGAPMVIPTAFGLDGAKNTLYIHGSAASRMQRELGEGIAVCITVTVLDGLVLARSGFNSSMNYRSVVVLGRAMPVSGDEEKTRALAIISEQILRGRWKDVRGPNPRELKATSVLRLPITEASAKVRSGPPHDDAEDYALDVWAGVLPVLRGFGEAEPDPELRDGIAVPEYVKRGDVG